MLGTITGAEATAGAVTPYDPSREVLIQVDACRLGVGAVLCQLYSGGKARPVAFFSKAYKEPAWQWRGPNTDHDVSAGALSNRRPKQKPGSSKPPQLLELRGIVESVLHWRNYVIGNMIGIKILSDHGSLRYVESQRNKGLCSDQTERWCNFLSSVQAKVSWRAGAGLSVADYLSRHAHDERTWDDLKWKSKYDQRADGMKPVGDVLKDVTYDTVDFGDGCDALIDDKSQNLVPEITAFYEKNKSPTKEEVIDFLADKRYGIDRKEYSNRYLSEDYMFCYNVQRMGMKVWLCPWMELKHVGSYIFGGSLAHLASVGAAATADPSKLGKKK